MSFVQRGQGCREEKWDRGNVNSITGRDHSVWQSVCYSNWTESKAINGLFITICQFG